MTTKILGIRIWPSSGVCGGGGGLKEMECSIHLHTEFTSIRKCPLIPHQNLRYQMIGSVWETT